MKASRFIPIAGGFAILAAALAALIFFRIGGSSSTAKNPDTASLSVSLLDPEAVQWPETLKAFGGIEAWQEVAIDAEVNGLRLAEILIDVGDVVEKGQLLARFDDESLQAEVAQQKAVLSSAQASLAEAEGNAKRAEALRKSAVVSEQDRIQFLTREQVARAQVESARAALKIKELQLRKTRVLAPDAGVISARSATLGNVVGYGTSLFRMVRQGRLEWRAELSASQTPQVSPGQTVLLTLPDGSKASGTVRSVAPTFSPATRLALAYVDLDPEWKGHPSSARAGMFSSGEILLGRRKTMVVPETAVLFRNGRSYVFVLQEKKNQDKEDHVRLVEVETGQRLDGKIELRGNDAQALRKIVSRGAAFLADGSVVRVVDGKDAEGRP